MRRVRVRCLTPGLAFSAFLVVMLQWYTLQVLHSVRNDAHAFTSFVESVERPARSLPALHSLLDELDEEGGTDMFLGAVDDNVDNIRGSEKQEAPARKKKGEGRAVGSNEQAGQEAAAVGADTAEGDKEAKPATADLDAVSKPETETAQQADKQEDSSEHQALVMHKNIENKVIVDKNNKGSPRDTTEDAEAQKEVPKSEKESVAEDRASKEASVESEPVKQEVEAKVEPVDEVPANKAVDSPNTVEGDQAKPDQASDNKADAVTTADPGDEDDEVEEEVVTIRRRKRHKAVVDADAHKVSKASKASKALTPLGEEDKTGAKTQAKKGDEEGSAGVVHKRIGIYSIFIGVYKTFLPNFLVNMRGRFIPSYDKVFFIVTDDAELCERLNREEKDVQCVVKERIGWPYESLYRWAYYQDFDASKTDYVWFFNSNSQVVDTVTEDVLAPYTAVLHDMYVGKPYDVATFEKRPLSFAFVPNRPHYRYFGARMLGATTENFAEMCRLLDRHTRLDEANQIIADWHDESHYNHYINVVLDGKVKVLGTEYHVPEEYGPEYMPTGRKVIYLHKKTHIPNLAATKSTNWQDWVGGKVKVHKYFDLPAFQPDLYKELNYEAQDMTVTQMIQDYRDNFESRLYFHETPVFADSFDAHRYRSFYNFQQSENWCKLHYYRWGYKESRHYFLKKGAETQDIAIPTVIYYDENDPPKPVAVER